MRFFKAFNLLHRRTKSATFVPGISAHTLDFATATTDVRSSSFTVGEGCRNAAPSSLFDLVTSNPPPIPVHFNHLNDTSDRVLGIWRSRRNSNRNSLVSLQSSVNKELARLSEAVNFWILEYTKIQNLLRDCHDELLAEKLKTAKLERTIAEVRQKNTTLHASLDLHEKGAGESSLTGFSGDSGILQSTSVPTPRNQVILYPRTQLPSTSSGTDSLAESIKPRTLDEYSSALRMTIMARKELRDQKKITKFWKNLAVTVEEHQDTITPSVSTISSIREVIPADRQAAVQALMSRRALTGKLRIENTASSGASCSTRTNSEDLVPEEVTYALTSSLSKSSGFSRLRPLASESMKQEVNILFGSSSIPRRLALSPTRRNGALEVSKSTSFKGGLSGNANHSLSIESFEDISMIFQRAFGLDTTFKRETTGQSSKESDTTLINIRLPTSVSRNELIASSSSTCLPSSSLPSTYSQVWVNIDSPKPETENTILGSSRSTTNIPNQTMKLASKECTSRRSWQKYIAKPSMNRASGDQLPSKEIAMRKSAGGKENNGFSMSLPAFKKKNSRLPVPVFTKTGR